MTDQPEQPEEEDRLGSDTNITTLPTIALRIRKSDGTIIEITASSYTRTEALDMFDHAYVLMEEINPFKNNKKKKADYIG